MCGFCGIVVPDGVQTPITRELVVRMRDTLVHRGPDGSGVYLEPGVGLGHRRLSIIDVSAGQQPMSTAGGDLHIVYNGEIYNHADLRSTLQERGHHYRTRCDTESILHLYQQEGDSAWQYLRGMFAFAIWDSRRRELVLVRDRLGVKPLYYALRHDGTLIFGSEIKCILASGLVSAELNVPALSEYLANHATFGDTTLFGGIQRLLPGHSMRWKQGRLETKQFWDLQFDRDASAGKSSRACVEEYHERFREAVRLRLMSDVPLGCLLSGGIDSAAITAEMSGLMSEPVKTFSVAFTEREANELEFARLVARRFKTDHHEILLDPSHFLDALPRMVWHEDEPIAHLASVALYFVCCLAGEHVKVVLTGEGSDETLAGYGRYRTTLLNMGVGERYESLIPSAVRSMVRRGVGALPKGSIAQRKLSRTFLALPSDFETLYFDNFAVFSRERQARLLTAEFSALTKGTSPYGHLEEFRQARGSASRLNQLLYVDIRSYLHELLMKQDQMSMAASIESRVPFLDHPLVEFTARLPDDLKLHGRTTKYVLRQSMAGILPNEILERPKMGFPVPFGQWMRGKFRHVLDEFVAGPRALARGIFRPAAVQELVHSHVSGRENHAQRLWSLINLEIWQRIHLDGEAVEHIQMTGPAKRAVPAAPIAASASPKLP